MYSIHNNKITSEIKNGRGILKEFNEYDGKLRFEGQFLYDQKLKGKYYIDEILEYEGEFLFNKKWNGKGYDIKGNKIYELSNGNGKVKEYGDLFGKLIFEGEYLNGKSNGKGKEFYSDGKLLYKGDYLNGMEKFMTKKII